MRVFPGFLMLLALGLPASAEPETVRIQVIDRGQADGSLIRTPNGKWVVIDAGADDLQAEAMAENWGVGEIALVIVSHRDPGHYGGMEKILRDFTVKRLVMNLADCPESAQDDAIRELVQERGVPRQSFGAATLEVDGVLFKILRPDPVDDPCPRNENDNSIVVRMEFGEFSMLFPGDAGTKERTFLMSQQGDDLDVDVLKASNHGASNGATGRVGGKTWMEYVDPTSVVISVGGDKASGLPQDAAMKEYEAVGADHIHCTSRHGTVRIVATIDGSYSVEHQFNSDRSCRK
jgi:competence protein ComEC